MLKSHKQFSLLVKTFSSFLWFIPKSQEQMFEAFGVLQQSKQVMCGI